MKKAGILLSIAAAVLSACVAKVPMVSNLFSTAASMDSRQEYVRYQNRFAENNGIVYFENSYSMIGEKADLMMYCELSTGISGPLCGKPECTHDNPDCNAYIGYNSENDSIMPDGLFVYDGRLYYTIMRTIEKEGEGLYLYSMALDGTGRKTEMKLGDFAENRFPNQNNKSLMHRGYFFMCGGTPYIRDGEWVQREMLSVWSLKTQEKMVLFEWEDPRPGRITYSYIQAFQDQLYYLLTFPEEKDENKTEYSLQLYKVELSTLSMEKLFEGTAAFEVREMRVTDSEIWISDAKGIVYQFDFKEGTLRMCFPMADEEEETGRVYFSEGIAYCFTRNDRDEQFFTVRDPEGNELTHQMIRDKVSSYIRFNLGNDSENVYVYYSAVEPDALGYLHKLVSYRIKDGEEKTLWLRKTEE